MAKPTKHATKICVGLTIGAGVGIIAGVLSGNPIWTVLLALPAAGYQAYRTEGETTRWASWVLLLVLGLEVLLLLTGLSIDLGALLGRESQVVAGYEVPLGDLRVVGPMVVAVLAIILVVRTRGRYTRWLAGILFACALAIVYVLDHTLFAQWLDVGLDLGLRQLR